MAETSVTITMRGGAVKEFRHEGRDGGSYTKEVKFEGSFVIVTDEYKNSTAIPYDLVACVEIRRRGG